MPAKEGGPGTGGGRGQAVIGALVLAAALGGAGDVAAFRTTFPGAATVASPADGRLTFASGFEASGLGDDPAAAASAFLARHGAAFGVTARHELVARGAPAPGRGGRVRFERRIDGRPLFDGDVVVGVNGRNGVILVNAADVPPRLAGRPRLSRSAAIEAARTAIPGLETSGAPRAQRGWRAAGRVVRPVWRVDLAASRPPGDWRSYVDAETGRVLLRVDLRADAGRERAAGGLGGSEAERIGAEPAGSRRPPSPR